MRKKPMRQQFGELPPKYHFSLNPYPEVRFSSCPCCGEKTGQRKVPLLIHIDPGKLIALNYTHRYCSQCDMLIGHKDQIEQYLTQLFSEIDPELIGNDYLIMGTVEKKAWRENMNDPKPFDEMVRHIHEFKSYQEVRMRMAGWFKEGQEPPVMEPPPSTDWVKK